MVHKLNKERPEQNVLTSPVSAYASLMMLHLGAGEKTRKELESVLKISDKETE